MLKIIITVLILLISVSSNTCYPQIGCINCTSNSNAYTCVSCNQTQGFTIYLWSCHQINTNSALFIVLSILLIIPYVFMLTMGMGSYHSYYENIQLASIITWAYGSDNGSYILQSTNLAIESNNDFPSSFGGQFIAIMSVMFLFWLFVLIGDKIPHKPFASLITRKRIIFPTRFLGFFFNFIIFSSIAELSTISTQADYTIFSLILAILALLKGVAIYVGTLFLCNFKKFKVDDPEYYVITEKLTNSGFYAKNNLFINLTNKLLILLTFSFAFEDPQTAGIVMIISQSFYTIYELFLPWIKYRYRIVNGLGNLLLIGIILCSMGCGISGINGKIGDIWKSYQVAYLIIIIIMCSFLIIAMIVEIIVQRNLIRRQIKQFFSKLCDSSEKNQDEDSLESDRQNVIKLQPNQLYQRDLPDYSN